MEDFAPHPPEPEPDRDAIRAALRAKQAARDNEPPKPTPKFRRPKKSSPGKLQPSGKPEPYRPRTVVERFQESTEMNYEKWHDGIGYDLETLKTATPEELVQIENLLVNRP